MNRIVLATLLSGSLIPPCPAADADPASQAQVEELRREINELKSQLKDMKQEKAAPVAETKAGAGPAASQSASANPVSTTPGLSFFGYGEINYNHYLEDPSRSQADLRRFVVGVGYAFNDHLRMNSEIEWEHAVTSANDRGESEIEQAYLEYDFSPKVSVKGGLFLMPFGLLNEHHEPPVFYGVERNEVETRIIPSTWREGGIGIRVASDAGITYEAGITTGFDITKFDNAGAPLAGVHQELQFAHAHDPSFYGAVNYRGKPGLLVGGAVFTGNSTQGNANFNSDNTQPDFSGIRGRITLWDIHTRYQIAGFDLQALYAQGRISGAGEIDQLLAAFNAANPGDKRAFVPDAFKGWYAQAAYKLWERDEMSLSPFVRYEYYNTQSSMPAGFDANPANAQHVSTAGVTFRLHPQVVIKSDYQKYTDKDNNRFNVGLGYMF